MIGKTAERIWGAALSMSPGNLIDKFLDWLDEVRGAIVPAHVEGLARIEERRDRFSA